MNRSTLLAAVTAALRPFALLSLIIALPYMNNKILPTGNNEGKEKTTNSKVLKAKLEVVIVK